MTFRFVGLMLLSGWAGCEGGDQDGESDADDESGGEMPPGDESGLDEYWMARAKVGRMEGRDFVELSSREFGPEGVPGGGVGLVEAKFGNEREIIMALPSGGVRRMDASLSEEVAVQTLRETGVVALDLDGDSLDEVVNFMGDLNPKELVLVPGTQDAVDWGPALRYPLDYRPEGVALVPASSERGPGVAICHEDRTMNSSAPAHLVVLAWDENTVTERWSFTLDESWCGFNVVAQVGGEPTVVIATNSSRVLALREGEDAPLGVFQGPQQLRNGLVVADLRGDGTAIVVMKSLVRQSDTIQDHEITAVPLTEDGFGEAVTLETEWIASFSAGDVDGDGADEVVLAQWGGTLHIVDLVGDELSVSAEYRFDDLSYVRAPKPWAAVPMDLSDDPADELVVVGYPYEVYE